MSHLLPCTLLAILVGVGPATPDEVKPAVKPTEVAAYFHDGTVIHRVVVQDSIEIVTRFGKLAVPIGDIRRIEFGHRVPEDVAQKIEDAIKHLGHEQFPQREAAGKELVALGKQAYPALLHAAQSPDKEVSLRAKNALEKIREKAGDEPLQFRSTDIIYTSDCVLTGRISASVFKVQTQKFGEMQFKLSDLKTVYSMATSSAEIAVEAAPFSAAPDKWLETSVEVEAGMGLVIHGSGKVDLTPQQPGQFVSGPEGCPNAGQNMGFVMGTLLGRIGEKGDIFVIGKRFETKAHQSGKLYVFIVPVQGGNPPAGSYKLKATAGFSLQVNPIRHGPQPTTPAGSYGVFPVPTEAPIAVPVPNLAPPPLPAPPPPVQVPRISN